MAGDHELLQLANLLKLWAETVNGIAKLRNPEDFKAITRLSSTTFDVARDLERVVTEANHARDGLSATSH